MFQQTLAITRNTFFESVRQPIMLVVLGVATFLLIMANPLSGFTMADDQRMLVGMGLPTIFLCGALLSAFIATNVLGREIENRTVLTVVSKPVSRPLFVLGKYFGVALALTLGTMFMAFVFLLVDQHKVLQTVRDPVHLPVVVFGVGAAILGLGVAVWCNYFYGKVFASTAICTTTPLAGLAYLFSMMFRPDFSSQPIAVGFKAELWLAIAGLLIAILVLTAIALAASTRFGQVMTLVITIGLFMCGMLSDWFIGRPAAVIEQNLSFRAQSATERELQGLLSDADRDGYRRWATNLYVQQAVSDFNAANCDMVVALRRLGEELRSRGQGDREVRVAATEQTMRRDAAEKHRVDLEQAPLRAAAVNWPPTKAELVIERETRRTVHRVDGDCDNLVIPEVAVFPPLIERLADVSERWSRRGLGVAYAIVPNFQVLLLVDAVTQGHRIPPSYLVRSLAYGVLYIVAALSLAVMLFQRREVG